MIGKTISHYRILEKLGGGGMGVVYKAQDTKLKRTVALKFLPPDLTRDDEAKERFLQEARAASKFDHPNICTIYEIDETPDGQTFIVMAYLEGETLKSKIESGSVGANGRSPLPGAEAVDIAIQIAKGLAKAHEKGIMHRDIKPANVMVTRDSIVKILDFGLAKLTGATQLTKTGTTMGTVAYMSPEQAVGEKVDHRTDIWSLGVVLYEMLCGQLPFKGEYEQAVVYSILNEDPERITDLQAEIPSELETIVNKALQKDSPERYQSAEEMLSDLQAFREGTKPAVAKTRPVQLSPKKRVYLYGGLAALLVFILIGFFIFRPTKTPPMDKIRLAVLPFDNITRNPDDEYFADGMTDEMISKLSKIAGFGVIARTSVMQYKTAPKTISEIGQELRVSKILEGSVRKAADKLRITVQLVDVATQEPIWSDDYDRQLADVFAIQSEVAQQVASALRVELSPSEKSLIEKRGTESLEAYNLYLQGSYYANKRTPQGLNKGIEYFSEAINLDPEFAIAFAGLANSYNIIATYSYLPSSEVMAKGKAAALRALEIDKMLAEAHTELARILYWLDWDWPAAENAFKRAVELNPSYARAHQGYARFLTHTGRHEQALAEIKRTQKLDPLYLISHTNEGEILYYARRYDEAIEKLNETIAMEPNFLVPYLFLGLSYLEKGMVEQASVAAEKYIKLSGSAPIALAFQGYIYARAGKRSEAQPILDQLKQLSKQRYVAPSFMALIYTGMGENDRAFEGLEEAYKARDLNLIFLKVAPFVDSLRSDPRFTALLKKIGLEE
ncbi:MAG: protein kinase [bacterium]